MQVSQTSLSSLLSSEDAELPVLKQLGFRRPDTSSTDKRKPRWSHSSDGPFKLGTGNVLKPTSTVSKSPHSSGSSSSSNSVNSLEGAVRSPPAKTTLPFQLKNSSSIPASGPTIADKIQADQLTSCLSRIKYLYDESENSEAVPLSIPAGSSYSDQRSLIKAQAQIIRNQLDLKFSSISFLSQLGKFNENSYMFESTGGKYNPLQVIRDRRKRPAVAREPHRVNVWQIPVSEQIQDIRWRFRTARTRAHKQRRKQRKNSAKDADARDRLSGDPSHSSDTLAGSPTSRHSKSANEHAHARTDSGMSESSTAHDSYHSRPQFTNPFLSPNGSSFGSSSHGGFAECPTNSLPKSECTELISRLRSRHSVYADEQNVESMDSLAMQDGSAESSTGSRKSFSADEGTYGDDASWARRRFCRNSASVADTWNRLYKARTNSSNSNVDDNHLKPLTKTISGSSAMSESGESMNSTAIYDGDEHSEVPLPINIQRPSTSRLSTATGADVGHSESRGFDESQNPANNQAHGIQANGDLSLLRNWGAGSSEAPPILTVTSNDGKQKILDDPAKTTSNSSPEHGAPSRPRLDRMRRRESYNSEIADMLNDEADAFGSLRPSANELRKTAYERKLCDLETDLKFLIPFYRVALRREEPNAIRNRSQLKIEACITRSGDQLGDTLKKEVVTSFLTYLSKVEHSVVSQQVELDADIATSLDGLRVTTDLIASEVNTTLNRRLREVSGQMERLYNFKDCGYVLLMLYSLLEYGVLGCMWVIWCGVQCWKLLSFIFCFVRLLCNQFVVA